MSFDREHLRKLASQATPGPWEARRGSEWDFDGSQVAQSSVRRAGRAAITWDDHGGDVFVPADAEFIAAAREAVPALLDALDAEKARADRAEAAVQRVREMHHQIMDEEECPSIRDLCAECYSVGSWETWPCSTARAVEGVA